MLEIEFSLHSWVKFWHVGVDFRYTIFPCAWYQANGHFGAVFQYCYMLDEGHGLIPVRKLRRDYRYAVRMLTDCEIW